MTDTTPSPPLSPQVPPVDQQHLQGGEYRAVFERAAQPMWIVDATGAFLAVNDAALAHYGYAREAFLRINLAELNAHTSAPPVPLDSTTNDSASHATHIKHDGTIMRVQVISREIEFAGQPARLDTVIDLSAREREDETLRHRNAYLAAAHELSLDLLNRLDLSDLLEAVVRRAGQLVGTTHGFMYWQPDAHAERATVTGIGSFAAYTTPEASREKDLTGKVWRTGQAQVEHDYPEWPDGTPVGDDESKIAAVGVPITADAGVVGVLTLAYVGDGRRFSDAEVEILGRFAELASIALDNARLYGLARQELRERERIEEQLRFNATHDPLTNLPNRTLFIERLETVVQAARLSPDRQFAVLFLDLDRFKNVNDSLGHLAGDHLLVSIARRLEACVKPGDLIARFGGDEFAVLLEGVRDSREVETVAECVLRDLPVPITLWGHNVFTTGTIGIAMSTIGYGDATEVLRDADTAMYHAKAQGGASYVVFDAEMRVRAVARLRMESDLRNALEHGEFRVRYQPIVSLADGAITGFEALVRWQHPELGLLTPADFLPVAEETGFIILIDQWVLRTACNQLFAWQQRDLTRRPLMLSVNLSGKHFAQAGLLDEIRTLVRETGIDPHALKLEITEGVLVENTEIAASLITQLREFGVQVDVDDFGTGYSSLRYLQRLPIDALKIDRSFIMGLSDAEEELAIVRMIVTLARTLHLTVIAEGIETEAQRAIVRDLACDFGQGYLFSQPLGEEEATALLFASSLP